mgnify:CR=1 FL=1
MKKLLALTLALMLLLTSAAFAENAAVLLLSNMQVSVGADGQEQVLDLTDAIAAIAAGAPDGVPTIDVELDNGDAVLLGGVMQIVDNKVVMSLDGMSRAIAAAIPTESLAGLGEDPMAGLGELFANLDQFSDVKMPVFTGVNIPKIDLMGLAEFLPMLGLETQTDGQATTFSIPWELLKQVLSMIPSMVPAEASDQLAPLTSAIDQLVASDEGFALEGRIADDGATAELLLDLYPVSGDQTADAAVGGLYFASADNADSLQLLIYQDGQSIALGEISLASDPEAATLAFSVDLMGEVTFTISLYPDEVNAGCQVVELEVNAGGETVAASVNYGTVDTMEFVDFALDAAGQAAVSLHIDETPQDDGTKAGSLLLYVQSGPDGQEVAFSADLVETYGDYEFRTIENTADAYDAESMTEAENQAFGEDLNNALAPLYEYIGSLEFQPAA